MLENGLMAGLAALTLATLAYFFIVRPIVTRRVQEPRANFGGPTQIPRNILLLGLIILAFLIVTLIVLTGARA